VYDVLPITRECTMRALLNFRALPLPIALLAAWACGPSFEDARSAWQRARPDSYVFEYQRSCVCPGSGAWWRVTVRRDTVVDAQLLDAPTADRSPDYALGMSHPTLSQLFDGIAAFANRPHTWTRVRYDRHWRFPIHASGDATDRLGSQWRFSVRNFHPTQ
jgi:hypothetical protein